MHKPAVMDNILGEAKREPFSTSGKAFILLTLFFTGARIPWAGIQQCKAGTMYVEIDSMKL